MEPSKDRSDYTCLWPGSCTEFRGVGVPGVALGLAVTRIETFEAFRGNLAAWVLLAFGLVFFVWGLRQAAKNRSHRHFHTHLSGPEHDHDHHAEHAHVHTDRTNYATTMTSWVLFTIFVFGPCEPLIPLLMYPAVKGGRWQLVLVTLVFAIVTIATMMTVVLVSASDINLVPVSKLERYTHALAGLTIFLCGASIQFLGL